MSGKWILKCIGFAALTVLGIFAFGYLFMLLWNALLPELFGLHAITFWQGVGLLVLGKMLFGGFGSRWRGRHGHCGYSGYGWRKRWEDKMMNMSPEEREKFKQRMKEKCGYYYGKEDDQTVETKT